jgi:hypothetical protein
MWMLYLARPIVQDQPLPWQRPQRDLPSGIVKRGIGTVFRAIDNPALPPKPRGIPPGLATRQAKETAGAISGSAQGIKTAKSRLLFDMKLDC